MASEKIEDRDKMGTVCDIIHVCMRHRFPDGKSVLDRDDWTHNEEIKYRAAQGTIIDRLERGETHGRLTILYDDVRDVSTTVYYFVCKDGPVFRIPKIGGGADH